MKLSSNDIKLIKDAQKVIVKSRPVNLIDTGEVGSALVTSKGHLYSGVSMGFIVVLVLAVNTKQLVQ